MTVKLNRFFLTVYTLRRYFNRHIIITFVVNMNRPQEKDHLEMQQRVMERDLSELRDKLMATNRSLGLASSNIASQEATISTLRSKNTTVFGGFFFFNVDNAF